MNIFNQEIIINWLLSSGIKILVIIIVAYLISKIIKFVVLKVLRGVIKKSLELSKPDLKINEQREKTLIKVFNSIITVVIWVIAFLTILPELGINITPLLTGLGIGGLALGLASRSLIQDYLVGLFILLEDHYRVGEEIQAAGVRGRVVSFNLRKTVLEDENKVLHYLPSSQIKQVDNFSRR